MFLEQGSRNKQIQTEYRVHLCVSVLENGVAVGPRWESYTRKQEKRMRQKAVVLPEIG